MTLALGAVACDPAPADTGAKPEPQAAQAAPAEATPQAPAAAEPAPMQMQHGPRGGEPTGPVTRVANANTVCMMNDQDMGSVQIPVEVEGRTYYGCCDMCKQRLNSDPKARQGTDPVTKKPVDKASAVLAKTAEGRVLYFENEDNLATYIARAEK
ncbi:MAG: hypothetical protein KF915_18265 [Polyangiaceae bacterium]|nr:hypothetical protein [Polyangiaceae bacterium]